MQSKYLTLALRPSSQFSRSSFESGFATACGGDAAGMGRSLFGMSTRIREFRKLRGMTLQHLAQKIGTTAQTIQRLETDNMTVSLDWLQRIGAAFGVPAAALIVSEATVSVPVLGHVGATGEVTRSNPDGPAGTLSLVIAAPSPVAVRVAEPFATFESGTVLIGNRIEFDPEILADARDCLVGLKSSRIVFRRVTTGAGGTVLAAPHISGLSDGAPASHDPADIQWIAPILMAVRYF